MFVAVVVTLQASQAICDVIFVNPKKEQPPSGYALVQG